MVFCDALPCSTYRKYIFRCSTFSFVALETNRFWATFPRVPGHLGLCNPLWDLCFLHFHRVMEMSMRAVRAKMLQLCPPLCDPINCIPPGFSVHRILQARILEWVAMPSSRGSSQPWDNTCVPNISFIGRQVLYHDGNEQVHSNEQVPYWLHIFHCLRKWQPTPVGWKNFLAWKIPWTAEPGRLPSMGLQRVGHDWATSLSLQANTGLSWTQAVKQSVCNSGDWDSVPGLERSPREENSTLIQHSYLENSMGRGAWWAIACGTVAIREGRK